MLAYLRSRPWGMRLLAAFGFVAFVPLYLYQERDEIAYGYKIMWRAFVRGGTV